MEYDIKSLRSGKKVDDVELEQPISEKNRRETLFGNSKLSHILSEERRKRKSKANPSFINVYQNLE